MDMRRFIQRKDEFDEVDELQSLMKKTGAQKVAASHHGSDAGVNESTGVQDGSQKHMNFILLIQTIFNNECPTDLCLKPW